MHMDVCVCVCVCVCVREKLCQKRNVRGCSVYLLFGLLSVCIQHGIKKVLWVIIGRAGRGGGGLHCAHCIPCSLLEPHHEHNQYSHGLMQHHGLRS